MHEQHYVLPINFIYMFFKVLSHVIKKIENFVQYFKKGS